MTRPNIPAEVLERVLDSLKRMVADRSNRSPMISEVRIHSPIHLLNLHALTVELLPIHRTYDNLDESITSEMVLDLLIRYPITVLGKWENPQFSLTLADEVVDWLRSDNAVSSIGDMSTLTHSMKTEIAQTVLEEHHLNNDFLCLVIFRIYPGSYSSNPLSSHISSEVESSSSIEGDYTFTRKDNKWLITFNGRKLTPIKNSIGIEYIHRLIQAQGQWFDVQKLYSPLLSDHIADLSEYDTAKREGDFILDKTTIKSFRYERNRLNALLRSGREDISREDIKSTIDKMNNELRKYSSGSKKPRTFINEPERIRKSVSDCILRAIKKLSAIDSELGNHLEDRISTGGHCKYKPLDWIYWNL